MSFTGDLQTEDLTNTAILIRNIKKYLHYHLGGSVGNVWTMNAEPYTKW